MKNGISDEDVYPLPSVRGSQHLWPDDDRALIIAAIAVVAWGAYNHMGHDIGSMANGIDSNLTNA